MVASFYSLLKEVNRKAQARSISSVIEQKILFELLFDIT